MQSIDNCKLFFILLKIKWIKSQGCCNCDKCKLVNKDNILKIFSQSKGTNIICKTRKISNKCSNKKPKIILVKKETILTNNEINNLGNNLIKQHLEKTLYFHIDHLRKNNIPFSRNKIKNLIQK